MKFKAVIVNDGTGGSNQALVLHVLQALQKLDRATERKAAERRNAPASVMLKLSPEAFAFRHLGSPDEGYQTWSHFAVARLFQEYRIESRRNNKIDLEVPIGNLVHVFTSCATGDSTTIRLANGRDRQPVLSFEFSLAGNAADHKVQQEVPVRVIPELEADQISEPPLPEPEYQIELPQSLSRLRNVLERMRAVGAQYISVEAGKEVAPTGHLGMAGNDGGGRAWLRLAAETDLVEVATTFPALPLITEGKSMPSPEGPVRLLLSLRRLAELLSAVERMAASAHIACILEGRALVLYALLPQNLGSLISYASAILV